MAAQKPTLPKGTRDFGPADVQKRKHILNTIETVFKKYGFMPLETPTMENLTTLEGKYGEEGDKLLFRIVNSGDAFKAIKDKHGDQQISNFEFRVSEISEKGLRYDLTVPFARYVVMNRNEITFPFKRYQMQPVWRADRPQKGRYREFWQCDADVVGSDSLLNEVDLMCIYHEAFTKLFTKEDFKPLEFDIRINNRKILYGISEYFGAQNNFIQFVTILDKLDKIGYEEVKKELIANGIQVSNNDLNLLGRLKFTINAEMVSDNDVVINELTELQKQFESRDCATGLIGLSELKEVFRMCSKLNLSNLTFDPFLARGLSYYTGCIFEVAVTDDRCTLKSSIGGGGRYDNLTGIFGLPNVSGVGISFGLDRIYDVMDELKLFPPQLRATNTTVLFCHFDEASQAYCLPAAAVLRAAGIATEIYPDVVKKKPMAKQLDYANALQIPFAAIAGETEIQQQVFNLKNLTTGEQQAVTIEELIRLVSTN